MTADRALRLSSVAASHMRAGRVSEGIDAYTELLSIDPDQPEAWYNRAYLERCARRFGEAERSYRAALAAGISRPEEVHLNLAVILSEHLNRTAEAERELIAATALNGDFLPAWLNLGNLYEDLGRLPEARTAYRNAYRAQPSSGRAIARMAALDTIAGKADEAAATLREALGRAGLQPEDRAEIGYALGMALDSTGAYEEAFAAFAAANAERLRQLPAGWRYDPAAHEQLVQRLIETFPLAERADDFVGDPPIFICGMFRSGSTLVEQILARHSRVTAGGELEFIPAIVSGHRDDYPGSFGAATPEQLTALQAAYIKDLDAAIAERDVVTDKRPDNIVHVGLIKSIFPSSKIIVTQRNAIDNILSVFFCNLDPSVSHGMQLSDITHWHGQYEKLCEHWRAAFERDIHVVDYEQLVSDPRRTVGEILAFCDLAWEESCLSDPSVDTAVRTPSAWQVRQPLHQRSATRRYNYPLVSAEITRLRASMAGP
jgi:tetratricopeptide (TPR) repeat protein